MRTILYLLVATFSCLLVVGCSRDPNVEIVGSYFPGWMLSLAIGVALTVVAHYLLRKQGLHHVLGTPVLIYPGMVLLFTCVLWLCFFA